MKKLLIFSILANLVLLGVYLRNRGGGVPVPASSPASIGSRTGGKAAANARPVAWDSLPAEPAAMADQLKTAGVPNDVMRAIVAAKLEARLAARRAEVDKAAPPQPYWKAIMPESWLWARTKALGELRQMEAADEALLNRMFGPGPLGLDQVGKKFDARFIYGDLPVGKQLQLAAIEDDFQEALSGQAVIGAGLVDPSDRRVYDLLKTEKEKDLRAILGPQEYEEYELRGSVTASNLQGRFREFQPTQREYVALFQLQKAFDEAYPPDLSRRRQDESIHEAQDKLDSQVAAALGPERAAQFQRETDDRYRQLLRVMRPLEVPQENIEKAWEISRELERRLLAATPLGGAPSAANLEATRKEALQRVGAALGPKGAEAFSRRNGFSSWLTE